MKKFLLSGTALLALIPLSAFAMGLQVVIDGKAVVFADVPQSAWYAAHVRSAAEAGIVSGYKDESGEPTGKFGPSNRITIAEALKIAVEGAGYNEDVFASKIQSGVDHWASPYVAVAKAEGFAVIDNDVLLDSPASRAEVAALFTSAFRVDTQDVQIDERYSDVSMSTDFAAAISALSEDDVVSGDTDIDGRATGTFRPYDAINRAEVTKIVAEARSTYGLTGADRTPYEEEGDMQAEQNVVVYSDTGFSPQVLRIKKGDRVTFKNESSAGLWVASDPHPVHTDLSSFDAGDTTAQGGVYMFTFTQLGSFGFHNHANAEHKGTVIVEE